LPEPVLLVLLEPVTPSGLLKPATPSVLLERVTPSVLLEPVMPSVSPRDWRTRRAMRSA
jgi:hypothetical protein